MKQGDILRLRDGEELVCRVQTLLGLETPYLLCAPVVPRTRWGALVPKLHIPVPVDGAPHVIVMSQMVAIPAVMLGAPVADASDRRNDIVQAVDLLVTGF